MRRLYEVWRLKNEAFVNTRDSNSVNYITALRSVCCKLYVNSVDFRDAVLSILETFNFSWNWGKIGLNLTQIAGHVWRKNNNAQSELLNLNLKSLVQVVTEKRGIVESTYMWIPASFQKTDESAHCFLRYRRCVPSGTYLYRSIKQLYFERVCLKLTLNR